MVKTIQTTSSPEPPGGFGLYFAGSIWGTSLYKIAKIISVGSGSRGFDSHREHMSERFFRSNRPGYPHPVSSELENSGIRVAIGDCSVTERRRWRPPYQTGKTVHVHAKHYKHNEGGRTAPGVCGNGSVPLSHSGNVVTRIGIHTHTFSRIINKP